MSVAVVSGPARANPPGWTLAWEDDFDTFDETQWIKVDTNVPTNNSLQDYLPEQVDTQRGRLVITATDEPSRGLPFRSGQVISRSEQRLGRWEVRARLPTSRGMWPAIWLLPDVDRYPWPSGGEIDILENRGNQPHLTSSAFHYGGRNPYRHEFVYGEQQTAIGGRLTNYHEGFHTYAVDWTERYLRFYVDGVHHFTVHDEDVGGFLSQNTAPMQLVINNAIGGTFLPDPDATTQWPQALEIDWVRVYEPDPDSFVATLENGDFDQGAGVLAGWSVFGNDLIDNPNVLLTSEATGDEGLALKLFGPFRAGDTYSGVSQGITVAGGQQVNASLRSLVRSADSIAGTNNLALLKIEFYNEFGAKFGGDAYLGAEELVFATGETAEDAWHDHSLAATAPAGAAEARVSIVFNQPGRQGGAVHIDSVEFSAVDQAAAIGDYNADGRVDVADYTLWRDSLGETGAGLQADGDGDGRVGVDDYQIWRENFGAGAGELAVPVPEPTSGAGVLATLAGVLFHPTLLPQRASDPGARRLNE